MSLKIDNLNFKYNDNTPIFNDCKFNIKDGSKTVILGLNGIGKSTLFKIITNEIKCNSDIENSFKNIFYLPQNAFIPNGVTTFDYLSTVFFKNSFKWFLSPDEKEKINVMLKKIKLDKKKNVFVENLSGGEFQKLNLALGLLFNANLLLLDEPISNLDLINQKEVLDMIKNIDITTVLILHDLNYALKIGDDFIGINRSHKIIQAPKDEFFTEENLADIFGINFEILKNKEEYYVKIVD